MWYAWYVYAGYVNMVNTLSTTVFFKSFESGITDAI